ncbi:MAG: class I SAM-dependent methyltransferase [Bdellovibrionales bacterium]|nr:class I SAM-dependent methyltransferase [Bdellovibrionales bacterium]
MKTDSATPANSYDFDLFRKGDRDEELRRLDNRASARIDKFLENIGAAGFRDEMLLLEVGSGTGRRIVELAKKFSKSTFVGIDTSDELLCHARDAAKKATVDNVSFVKEDIHMTTLSPESFDFVYARLVIQHMPSPVETLKKIRELLKPGGVLYLEDTDRDWMKIYPAPENWDDVYKKVKAVQKKNGGDPNSGTKLAAHLSAAGFRNVCSSLEPVTGGRELVADWLQNYAPTFFTNMDAPENERSHQVLNEIKEMNLKVGIYFYQVWFHAFGVK